MTDLNKNSDLFRRKLIRLAVLAVVAAGVWIYERTTHRAEQNSSVHRNNASQQAKDLPVTEQQKPTSATEKPSASVSPTDSLVVEGLVLRDESGKVIYRGEMDLEPTLQRIADGKKLRFSHDGTTFQNREGRLPRRASGYYREWVVPTPGESGPGPQRLVTGDDGDVWYTSDHYRSFRSIPYEWPRK